MSENKIKDDRFQFLVDMGFEISEINNQLGVWCKGIIDWAGDEYMTHMYRKNLKTLIEKELEPEFILHLFFVHTDSFAILNQTFQERIDLIESELGLEYESLLKEDFWECGESKIFELIGWVTADKEEWLNEIKKEKSKMKRTEE